MITLSILLGRHDVRLHWHAKVDSRVRRVHSCREGCNVWECYTVRVAERPISAVQSGRDTGQLCAPHSDIQGDMLPVFRLDRGAPLFSYVR